MAAVRAIGSGGRALIRRKLLSNGGRVRHEPGERVGRHPRAQAQEQFLRRALDEAPGRRDDLIRVPRRYREDDEPRLGRAGTG
jgi:hypothetical protein